MVAERHQFPWKPWKFTEAVEFREIKWICGIPCNFTKFVFPVKLNPSRNICVPNAKFMFLLHGAPKGENH